MAISRNEFIDIIENSLGKDPYSLQSFKCPICGKSIRITRDYYKNGIKRKYLIEYFICTNTDNSHRYTFQDFIKFLLDSYEAYARAEENPHTFSNSTFI
jgi:hypothetical protein